MFLFRYTPLDYALMGEHYDVAQYMIEQGALSITGIQDIAALKIQVDSFILETFDFVSILYTFVDVKFILFRSVSLMCLVLVKRITDCALFILFRQSSVAIELERHLLRGNVFS